MNFLYLDIDTLSPRHMSCYGYNRETTPNIDKLVNECGAAKFENMYTSDAPCLPSRSSLITGQFGLRHGAVDHGGKYADLRSEMEDRVFERPLEFDGLFGLFKRAGLKTVSISSFNARHSTWHFNSGFNEVYCYGNSKRQQATEIYDITTDWLTRNKDQDNWFLHVHLWDPHTPYRAPDDYHPDFLDGDFEYWIDDETLATHKTFVGPHTATTVNMFNGNDNPTYKRAIGRINNQEDLKTVIDGYDVGIHYADYYIGKIIDQLKAQGQFENTVIILSGDHGENMGELGVYSEHGTADDATCRIPFIVKVPNKDYTNVKFEKLHYNIDLVPTVAELFNLKPHFPTTIWDGVSLLDCFKTSVDSGHEHLILSQMSHVLQRAVRFDNYIYIQTYNNGLHLHYDEEMLFDLENDFYEQHNIASQNKAIVDKAKVMLFDWHNKIMSSLQHKHCEDPLWYIYQNGGPFQAKGHLPKFIDSLDNMHENEKADQLREYYNIEKDRV